MKMSMASQPVDEEKEGPHDYEIEDAANTLMKAEEIKKNKKLMPHVHKHLAKKAKAITSVQDLRDKYKDMTDSEANGDQEEAE